MRANPIWKLDGRRPPLPPEVPVTVSCTHLQTIASTCRMMCAVTPSFDDHCAPIQDYRDRASADRRAACAHLQLPPPRLPTPIRCRSGGKKSTDSTNSHLTRSQCVSSSRLSRTHIPSSSVSSTKNNGSAVSGTSNPASRYAVCPSSLKTASTRRPASFMRASERQDPRLDSAAPRLAPIRFRKAHPRASPRRGTARHGSQPGPQLQTCPAACPTQHAKELLHPSAPSHSPSEILRSVRPSRATSPPRASKPEPCGRNPLPECPFFGRLAAARKSGEEVPPWA